MDRGNDKHSPRVDEELKHETQGLQRGGHDVRAEEWRSPEPSGEDQPDADLVPNGTSSGGTPPGMSGDDVAGRAELASYLGKAAYPAVREQLIGAALDHQAPDRVVDLVRRLPSGRQFHTVNEVWSAVGGHVEQGRF